MAEYLQSNGISFANKSVNSNQLIYPSINFQYSLLHELRVMGGVCWSLCQLLCCIQRTVLNVWLDFREN